MYLTILENSDDLSVVILTLLANSSNGSIILLEQDLLIINYQVKKNKNFLL